MDGPRRTRLGGSLVGWQICDSFRASSDVDKFHTRNSAQAEVRSTGGATSRKRHERARAPAAIAMTGASTALAPDSHRRLPQRRDVRGDSCHPAPPSQRWCCFSGRSPPPASRLRLLGSLCKPGARTACLSTRQRAQRRLPSGVFSPYRLPLRGLGSAPCAEARAQTALTDGRGGLVAGAGRRGQIPDDTLPPPPPPLV